MTERLAQLNPALCRQVKDVLEQNKAERHIRGGIATKEKYARKGGKPTPQSNSWR